MRFANRIARAASARARLFKKAFPPQMSLRDRSPSAKRRKTIGYSRCSSTSTRAAKVSGVAPGKTGEIIWTFNRPGDFEFACLLPGHFEAGMVGKILVKASTGAKP